MQAVCSTKKLVAGDNSGIVDHTIITNGPGLDTDMDISAFQKIKPSHTQHWVTHGIAILDITAPASQEPVV